MAKDTLKGLKVAILATDGFEQSELTEPRKALDEAGADTEIVSPKAGKVRGWKMKEWGEELPVDQALDEADPEDYDALVLPGGVINADALGLQPKAVKFVKAFFDADKPVGVICHAPWALIESGSARGHKIDVVAVAQDRSDQCGSALGGRRSGGGRQSRDQPKTRRPPRLQPGDHQAVSQARA